MIDHQIIHQLRIACITTLNTLDLCVENSTSEIVTEKLQAGITQCKKLLAELDNLGFNETELQSWTDQMRLLGEDLMNYAHLIMPSDDNNN